MRLTVWIVIVLFLLASGWFLSLRTEGTTVTESSPKISAQEPVFEKRRPVRDVTPREFVQAPKIENDLLERLPAVEPPKVKEKPKPKLWKQPQILQAGVLRSGGVTLRLQDIQPLPLNKSCASETGSDWPCGRFARTAFRNLIRGRTLTCDKDPGDKGTTVTTHCKLGSVDLSRWLVVTGWVEPVTGHYEEELEQAKAAQRGVWNRSSP